MWLPCDPLCSSKLWIVFTVNLVVASGLSILRHGDGWFWEPRKSSNFPCKRLWYNVPVFTCRPDDLYYFIDVRDGEIVRKRGWLLRTFKHAVAEQWYGITLISSLHSSDPICRRKKRIKRDKFLPVPGPFLFTVDISHMCPCQTVTTSFSQTGIIVILFCSMQFLHSSIADKSLLNTKLCQQSDLNCGHED